MACAIQAEELEQSGIGTIWTWFAPMWNWRDARQALLVAQAGYSEKALYALARLLDLDPRQDIQLTDQSYFSTTPEFPGDAGIAAALASGRRSSRCSHR